jgi:glycosyltransferase involved in cell wall biosynthesis
VYMSVVLDELPVSVIIPATRRNLLPWVLRSLYAQRYQGKREIIVVGTFATEFQTRWPIIPITTPELYPPGRARNLGAQQAQGSIIIFLDDDCAVPSDWIARNINALRQEQVGAVGARIRGKSRAFFARCTDFASFGDYQAGYPRNIPLAAASLGIWRTLYQQAGGFNETMMPGEEEDTDLCHRLQRLGYQTVYRPEIAIIHDHRRDTLGKLLRHTYHQGLRRGLKTKQIYCDLGWRNRLLASIRFPPLFLLLLPLIALAATLRIVLINVGEQQAVLLYAPFILLAKVAYNYGIFKQLCQS